MDKGPDILTATIGVFGLGYMGKPVALRLAQMSRNPVVIFDDDPGLSSSSLEGNFIVASSAKELANLADVIIGSSATEEAYRSDVLSDRGIIHGSRCKLYIHAGTNGSALVQELEAALTKRGIETLDAPITGGPPRAIAGTLTVMAAASNDILAKAEPFLQLYASKIVHVGKQVGAGQTMKVVNNIMSSTNLAIASEALVLGVKGGLNPEQILEVVNAGTGQNAASLNWLPDQVLTRNFNLAAPIISMIKDLKVAAEEAKSLDVPLPLGDVVRGVYLKAVAEGSPSDDLTSLIWHMERAAGVAVPKSR